MRDAIEAILECGAGNPVLGWVIDMHNERVQDCEHHQRVQQVRVVIEASGACEPFEGVDRKVVGCF